MIFSIIVLLTDGLTPNIDKLSILHPPFLLGLHRGRFASFTGSPARPRRR